MTHTDDAPSAYEIEQELGSAYRNGPFTLELISVGGFIIPWPEYMVICEQLWAMREGLA